MADDAALYTLARSCPKHTVNACSLHFTSLSFYRVGAFIGEAALMSNESSHAKQSFCL